MKKKKRYIICAGLIAVTALGGCAKENSAVTHEEQETETIAEGHYHGVGA